VDRTPPGASVLAAPEAAPEAAEDDALVCARCSHAITSEATRVSRGGAHIHTRRNPGGWVYQFGCFAEAPGCRALGEPSEEFTWFPGHAWRLAVCGSCGAHLGWRFDGASGSFFGLILERLSGG
jgi:hypothetical protein